MGGQDGMAYVLRDVPAFPGTYRRLPTMDETAKLLQELIGLQKASIRLQKFSITLQAESVAHQVFAATGGRSVPALDKLVMKSVRQMRTTLERVEAGRRLPK
jgi:hypothetical protein